MDCVTVHLLNVGHGDCTFIEHESGRLTMIDINNSKSLPLEDEIALAADKRISLNTFRGQGIKMAAGQRSWESYYRSLLVDPVDYYTANFAGRSIFRYIQTHPDMDHLSGLCRFFWQEGIELQNMWDIDHDKTFEGTDSNDWLVYELMRGGHLDGGRTHKVLRISRGDTASYWDEDGLQVWGPDENLVDGCNELQSWNNASYVLRLEYGGRKFVFPGDAEALAWDAVEEHVGTGNMPCDLLKAAHHGRNSGYYDSAVTAMDPYLVFCSVGKKPSTDASGKYAAHGAEVLSTRFNGSIVVKMWEDGEVEVFDHKLNSIGGLPILGG